MVELENQQVELLLRHGADPSLADLDGSTALDHALKATPNHAMVIAMLRSATT
jgi:ankyrin repeat protein